MALLRSTRLFGNLAGMAALLLLTAASTSCTGAGTECAEQDCAGSAASEPGGGQEDVDASSSASVTPPGADESAEGRCYESKIPVSLVKGGPVNNHIFGKLCLPAGQTPAAVQLLVHGVTYSHFYWDFPDPTAHTMRYSYVNAARGAGYATFAIDRIGIGKSSRPLSALITVETNAWVVHQVAQALRSPSIPGVDGKPILGPNSAAVNFSKIIGVGHSYGTMTLWLTASKHHGDFDGLILTGGTHKLQLLKVVALLASLYPASLDPQFTLLGQDIGYLTTRPGTRYDNFYAPAQADPAVIALDEATKSTATELETDAVRLTDPQSSLLAAPLDINVPVLLVMGAKDTLFCGSDNCTSAASLVQSEAPRLGSDVPCVDGFILPDAGHDINMMLNAEEWFAAAQEWADGHVGAGAQQAAACP